MTNNTLDAAIEAAHAAVNVKDGFPPDWRESGKDWDFDRTYARALIAKLTDKVKFVEPCDTWADGFNAGISEIRRRAGLEDLS
jgi:hypothetical protein